MRENKEKESKDATDESHDEPEDDVIHHNDTYNKKKMAREIEI